MIYHSLTLSGFWLNLEWLWQHPLPHPLEILATIAGISSQEIERLMGLFRGQP